VILDTLPHAAFSHALGPRFAAGLEWLATFSPDAADGRQDIDGDNVFALVQSYDTVPAAEKKFEAHHTHVDIQYVARGTEVIHYAPIAHMQPVMEYDAVKDYLLYADPAISTPLHLGPGSFAIFHPQDGHKPGCISGASCRIKKVVIKVRIPLT